ncbi:hypothetical protein FKM82_014868 [Ascaphus truei]
MAKLGRIFLTPLCCWYQFGLKPASHCSAGEGSNVRTISPTCMYAIYYIRQQLQSHKTLPSPLLKHQLNSKPYIVELSRLKDPSSLRGSKSTHRVSNDSAPT